MPQDFQHLALSTNSDSNSRSRRLPASAGAAFFGSGISVIAASVVNNKPAIDAAFCNAVRTTFVGSMIPAASKIFKFAGDGIESFVSFQLLDLADDYGAFDVRRFQQFVASVPATPANDLDASAYIRIVSS